MTSEAFTSWRKASYSSANGGCVEVGAGQTAVGVRDTVQHGLGPVLRFPSSAWREFISGADATRWPQDRG